MHKYVTDVTIIGAGPVGLFSIFQAGMLGMKCHVVDALESPGGQCAALYPEKLIYDIPAYPMIKASDLISNLSKQASSFDPVYNMENTVTDINTFDNYVTVKTNKNIEIKSSVLLIAGGAGVFDFNRPSIDKINNCENKSVHYMINDINKFKDKNVAIAGGGDSAMDWAVILSDIVSKLYIIHRRKKFRCVDATLNKIHNLEQNGKIRNANSISIGQY